jgi:hypothetical protein
MISNINKLNKDELYLWLKNEAGVNNGLYFEAFEGNLELQQIPGEYVEYLWFLKESKFESYMSWSDLSRQVIGKVKLTI